MTDGIKIPVSADVGSVKKGVEDIAKTIDRANRTKWNPIDLKAIERDAKRAEQILRQHGLLDSTQRSASSGGPARPAPARPSSTDVEDPVAAGSGGRRRRGRGRYSVAPDLSDVARNFAGGIGGGFGTIAGYGARGAYAGANSGGGMFGGGMGLLRGLGIGALAYGGLKAGQAVSEGVELSKDRALTLDALKRQMGDLGVNFNLLKLASEGAADSMGMNSKESAKLMEEFSKLSRGADKTEEALMQSVAGSGRFGRAYGIDPGTSAGFFAGVRHTDPRQNNRELALLLAEAINRSGMTARADEVMQAMQAFATATARMSLSSPNLAAYSGAYSDLVGSKTPGLDSETSANLLSQANASVMRMGGAGEAGQAFILAALQRNGRLNPIQAMALAQGGLFGTRGGVFDPQGAIGKYMGAGIGGMAHSGNADATNFEAIRGHLQRMGGDKWFQLEGAQRLFGVNSLSNAAALLNLSGQQGGGLQRSLRTAGVDINSLNESGIQTLAQIGGARDKGQLSEIFSDMARRSGPGSLSSAERDRLSAAQGGSLEEFRSTLIKVAAMKDQAETDGSRLRTSIANLETQEIKIGDKLLLPLNTMRDALISLTGKGEMSLARQAQQIRVRDVNDISDSELTRIRRDFNERRTATRRGAVSDRANYNDAGFLQPGVTSSMRSTLEALDGEQVAAEKRIEAERNARLREISMQEQAALSAGSGGTSTDGATPLPQGASVTKPTTRDQVDVNVSVTNRSMGTDGRVISQSSAQTRVPVPRGSGRTGVAIDAR